MASQERINEWLNGPFDQKTKQEILNLQKVNPTTLSDAFYKTLAFGTGGMRGLMGVGTNRMNRYTIQMATQGLANYLLKQPKSQIRHSVFIGFDSRHNSDLFAKEAARVLAGNEISVFLCPQLRPTPFVSFGVRQLGCNAGIMITASHNPKEYNGYKVYWSDGGQVVPPHDTGIMEEVKKIENINNVKIAPEKHPLIELVNPELDLEYLEAIKKVQINEKSDENSGHQLKITYTPLHGTGITLIPKALKQWGFSNVNLVTAQMVPDGDFPTVKVPNPEMKETLSLGIAQMQETLSDILIATDPDADRMAVAALHQEQPEILTGNQIAAIAVEYICQKKPLPRNGAIVTTIVSTDLIRTITESYHQTCFETLTGFKYIGELMHKWEKENHPYQFLFGAEESYGYLVGTHSRDKDAVVAACLIAEIAHFLKIEGRTLVDFLDEIYTKYGFFQENQKTLDFEPGEKGIKQMNQIMETLRRKSPKNILESRVILFEDYKTGKMHNFETGEVSNLMLPQSNVLLFRLEDQTKIIVRPSGTEPKIKIYIGVRHQTFDSSSQANKTSQEKLTALFHATENLLKYT